MELILWEMLFQSNPKRLAYITQLESSQISIFLRPSYSQTIALSIFTTWFLEGSKIILKGIDVGVYLSSPYMKSLQYKHTLTQTSPVAPFLSG